MFRIASALMVLAVAGCTPAVPDSGAGVGFDSYGDYTGYRAQREASLRGESPSTVLPPAAPVTTVPLGETAAAADAENPTPPAQPIATANSAEISDEQDFGAVSTRQTIESDAERLARQREAYKVIEPTALPSRDSASGPNIVQYAINSKQAVGQKVYRRSALSTRSRYLRNCGKYPSPDLAQEAFMRSGGPERDKRGLDPDGDGFACDWDPTPFRLATNG